MISLESIDRFIPDDSPIGRAGGARTLLRATDGNLGGAAFLALLARKESEFGRTSGRFRNNAWGWGVHLGPDVNTSPSWEEGARKVWRGLTSGLYKGAGLTTPAQIINRYAPPSENDTGLYIRQVNDWAGQLGLNPNASIFDQAQVTAPPPSGGQRRGGGQAPRTASSPSGSPDMAMLALQAIDEIGQGGVRPTTLLRMAASRRAQSASDPAAAVAPEQAPADAHQGGHTHPDGTFHFGPHETYGYDVGTVDSGQVVRGGEGNNWGGSLPRALHLARALGLPVTSQKRSRQLTASGGVSDHWQGSTRSYAVDLGTTPQSGGDSAYQRLMDYMARLSGNASYRNLAAGSWHNLNVGGYRYQIGWRTPGHFDHIHVGVQRL